MSKYNVGDRVRILDFTGRTDGVTGITGTVVSPATHSALVTVQLDRLFANLTTKRCDFLASELEYEDNRENAVIGDLMASVGDIAHIVANYVSCDNQRFDFAKLNRTYFKGQPSLEVIAPCCGEYIEVYVEDVRNICYENNQPSRETYNGV